MMRVRKRSLDLALFGALLALSAAAYAVTWTFPNPLLPGYPGSAMFPRVVLVGMGILAAFGIARSLLAGKRQQADEIVEADMAPFAAAVAVLLLFALLLSAAGMEVAVFAFVGGGWWFRFRRIAPAAIAGAAAVLVIYVLFVQVLSVDLPLTFLPRYVV